MRVTVNGEPRTLDGSPTVADVVSQVSGGAPVRKVPFLGRGVAIAVNGEVVPRSTWPGHPISEGDRIEILTAVQGG
jgi:sulfur carrier protein